jgi:hypothetical protein
MHWSLYWVQLGLLLLLLAQAVALQLEVCELCSLNLQMLGFSLSRREEGRRCSSERCSSVRHQYGVVSVLAYAKIDCSAQLMQLEC